jgi:uncharacterized protein YcbK (DUF882 family)
MLFYQLMQGVKMQLSPHFALKEFLSPDSPDVPLFVLENLKRLSQRLESVREKLGKRKIIITSGYRTKAHNLKVGGAPKSQHLTGSAADIVVDGMTPKQVQRALESFWQGGMGYGETFTHLDIRPNNVRFSYG